MNRKQRGRLGGLTTAARGTGNSLPGRQKFLDRFKNEAEKKLYFIRLAQRRWSKEAT